METSDKKRRTFVVHTYGDMLALKLRCISLPPSSEKTFLQIQQSLSRADHPSAMWVERYQHAAQHALGLDFWIPNPLVRHIRTDEGDQVDSYYWIHSSKSNQHRRSYQTGILTHAIRLDRIGEHQFSDAHLRVLHDLITMVNSSLSQ